MCWKISDESCCGNLRTLTVLILWMNLINGLLSVGSYTFRCMSDGLEIQWSVLPAFSITGVLIAAVALCCGVCNNNPSSLMVAVYFEATLMIADFVLVIVAVVTVFFFDFCEDELKRLNAAGDEEISCTAMKISYLVLSLFILVAAGYHWYAMSVIYSYSKKIQDESQNTS